MEANFKRLEDESSLIQSNESFFDPNITQSIIPLKNVQDSEKIGDFPIEEDFAGDDTVSQNHKKTKTVTFKNDIQIDKISINHKKHMSMMDKAHLKVPEMQDALGNLDILKQKEIKPSLMRRSINTISMVRNKISQTLGIREESKEELKRDVKYAFMDQSCSSNQSRLNDIDDSQDVEKIKSQLPENIVMLMLQPKRVFEFDEDQEIADEKEKFKQSMGYQSENKIDGSLDDDQKLLQAIAQDDQEFNQFLEKTVDLKTKQTVNLGFMIFSYKWKSRMYWDVMVILFAVYNSFMIPLEVAYSGTFFSESDKDSIEILENSIDACFCLDILISFRTSYLDANKGVEVTSGKMIAYRYVKSGIFFMDLAATLPIDVIVQMILAGESFSQLQLLGLVKLTRMIRLRKIIAFMNVNQNLKLTLRMVQLILFLLLILHAVACFWYLLVQQAIKAGEEEWIPPTDLEHTVTTYYQESASFQYLVTFYYAVLILIGRANEMAPNNVAEVIYCGFILILGSFVSTFIFSNIATVMESATQKDSIMTLRMNMIQSTMALIKLPIEIQDDIQKYVLQVEQAPQVQYDLQKFLDSLSAALRSQVLHYLHNRVISQIDIFSNANELEISFIASKLTTMLVLPQDIIVAQGTNGENMFFIINGRALVYLTRSVIKEEEENFKTQSLKLPQQLLSPLRKKLQQANNQFQFPQHQISLEESQDHVNLDILSPETQRLSQGYSPIKNKDTQTEQQEEFKLNVFEDLNDIPPDSPIKKRKRYLVKEDIDLSKIKQGDYFGEVAILSKLKRTANVKALDYCTLSCLSREILQAISQEYPQIYLNIKSNMNQYTDEHMMLRRQMIKNIPFFKQISENLVTELVFLLRETLYDVNSLVVKHGDLSDRIHIIWRGQLKVEVFYNGKDHQFERLNQGGCFCVFSAFSDDYTQIFDFKVIQSQAVIVSIKASDLQYLAKSNIELADILKSLDVQIKKHQKTDFDFFRFMPQNPSFKNPEYRRQLRLKFKHTLRSIARNLLSKAQKMTESLTVVQQICKDRKIREENLRMMMFKKDKYQKDDLSSTIKAQQAKEFMFSQSSRPSISELSSNLSVRSSLSDKLRAFIKPVHLLDQDEERLAKRKEEELKKKRKHMIKDILNPLEVPGIDIKIFERINGLPKDQNMYIPAVIENYENLKARIEKQEQTKENIQFLNRLVFKQNSDIYNMKLAFRQQIKDQELRMAALTQQIRKQRDKKSELIKIQKQEKILKINQFKEQTKKEEFFKEQYFQSFGQPYNSQINIQNQINNYIFIDEKGDLATKFTKVQNEFKPPLLQQHVHKPNNSLSKDNLLEQDEKSDHDSSPLTAEENNQKQQLYPIFTEDGIIDLVDPSATIVTKKIKSQRPKSQMRQRTLKLGQELQSQINQFGGSTSKSKKDIKKHNRQMSQLMHEESKIVDLSETLSKVEFLAMKNAQSRVLEISSSKQSGNIFSRAAKFKKKYNDQSQTTFLDEGGERSLMVSGLESYADVELFQKKKNTEGVHSRTKEVSRLQNRDDNKLFSQDISLQAQQTLSQRGQTQQNKNYRTRHSSAMDNMAEETLTYNFYLPENLTLAMSNATSAFEIKNQKYSPHSIETNSGNCRITPQNRFKQVRPKTPLAQKQVKLSEQDKQMWQFYRNMLAKHQK